jgi:hypothetical protein
MRRLLPRRRKVKRLSNAIEQFVLRILAAVWVVRQLMRGLRHAR